MTWFRFLMPGIRRSHPLGKLSPDNFEQLVYRLAKHCGEFSAVQWYSGVHRCANTQGRDLVAHKSTNDGLEKWYIQCKYHTRLNYTALRNELNTLVKHAAQSPGFTPHIIAFATNCDIPTRIKNKATVYARASGLPAPLYWDQRELNKMLATQPDTANKFFDQQGHLSWFRTQITKRSNWGIAAILGLTLFLVFRLGLNLPLVSHDAPPTSIPTHTQEPTPMPVAIMPTPTNMPTPIPTNTPTSTPTNTPTPSPTNTPTPTPTSTPTPTPTPFIVEPTLLDPIPGFIIRAAILKWEGKLGPGQYFVVHLQHLENNEQWESGPLTSNCWETALPAEWYGGWSWQVRVMQRDTILAQSELWAFWYDPYPNDNSILPPPCSE